MKEMPELQYDQNLSTDVSGQRRYWLDELELTQKKVTALSLMVAGVTQFNVSEDYADLVGSVGTLFQYVGHQMLVSVYEHDVDYNKEQFKYKDYEDLHLSLECIEQFGLIQYLVKDCEEE